MNIRMAIKAKMSRDGDHKKLAIFLLVGAILFHLLFLILACKLQISVTIKWVIANFVSVIIPGFATTCFFPEKPKGFSRVCISYALGYVYLVVEYFLSIFTHNRHFFTSITFIVCFLSIFIICKNRKELRGFCSELADINVIDAIIFLGVFFVNIFAYSCNYLGLEVAPEFTLGNAMGFWANNTVSLSKSWPTDQLFFVGNRLYYHYFSSIALAFLTNSYRISVIDLSFPLYAFSKSILLVGAIICLFDTVGANNRIKKLGSIIVLATAGLDSMTGVTFLGHLYRSPFGFDIGFAYGIYFISFFYKQVLNKRFVISNYIITTLFWIMCVGAKAPISVILIVPAGLMCLYWLVKKEYIKAFIYGISILSLFLAINYCAVGLFKIAAGDSNWVTKIHSISEIIQPTYSDTWDTLCRLAYSIMSHGMIAAILVRVISINPIMLFVLLISIHKFIKTYKYSGYTTERLFFLSFELISIILGVVMDIIVDAGNNSEGYFVMATIITGTFFCAQVYSIDYYEEDECIKKVNIRQLFNRIVFLGLLLFCLVRGTWIEQTAGGVIKSALVGARNVLYSNLCPDRMIYEGISTTINKEDAKALWWVRDNTPYDAVVLSDRAVLTDDEIFYLYGLFSERQQYIEGTFILGENRSYITTERDNRKKFVRELFVDNSISTDELREKDISYVIRTNEISPNFEAPDGLELVFKSDTIEIYSVK